MDEMNLPGSGEPPIDPVTDMRAPSAQEWRQVRLQLDLVVGILAHDADTLSASLEAAGLPDRGQATLDTLATVADILATWNEHALSARDRLKAILDVRAKHQA